MSALSDRFTNSLSLKRVFNFYGVEILQNGFAHCPFHRDDTASLKTYPDDRYYCFSCHSSGNIIDFVMKLFNIPYNKAMERIDSDFKLDILNNAEPTNSRWQYARKASLKKMQDKKVTINKKALNELIDLHRKYHMAILHEIPYSDLFCEALLNISDVQYRIEELENEHG